MTIFQGAAAAARQQQQQHSSRSSRSAYAVEPLERSSHTTPVPSLGLRLGPWIVLWQPAICVFVLAGSPWHQNSDGSDAPTIHTRSMEFPHFSLAATLNSTMCVSQKPLLWPFTGCVAGMASSIILDSPGIGLLLE